MELDITDSDYRTKAIVLEALHQVSDPELGINIVDLGLVYGIDINEAEKTITVNMTLSTPSCPLGNFITNHVAVAVESSLPDYDATAKLVWEPKWNADRISAQGKAELGW
ncbi:metal-sulfur cluster assembly factor [Polluticoccus soli]|uniref:metal-sulfur cluster assembly factor n=1 Tax=Polluticoccus soli TaxID=3034150 RepID=UPI0023E29964|nr:metal-sulfur cluster assembly factor [Flavipsychrobacter sp. JY13-12]